ncbi:MAG: hypothetical protein QOI20_2187 [Acidimicrobiaceae bacterium]|jgi:hypothetical protein|nr:hypothetical protein [Acidimicrobiaceae bacterium]
MDALTAEAWESLDQAAVVRLRDLVWDQPEDVPGVRTGADTYVLAHAGPQPFATLGWATALLANRFEAHGDDADLAAATELHDLTAALGDAVWESPDNAPVALGAATLYAVTGEQAFLATVERLADLLCEVQPLSELGASILVACADLVEPRLAMEAEAEAEAAAAAQAAAASTANDG